MTQLEVEAAAVVWACHTFEPVLEFLTGHLGFAVESVVPADHPLEVVVAGYGLRICLRRAVVDSPLTLRLRCRGAGTLARAAAVVRAPDGTRIEWVPPDAHVEVPPPTGEFMLTSACGASRWVSGRAGMQYRDLIPERLGGFLVGSHIRIPDGGTVPDYVHHHRVALQLIYCHRGWVRVVYEDQGPPFVMDAGDCVLQPPGIRHRVLESSPGLEVFEFSVPAAHETRADPALPLPTRRIDAHRVWQRQRFIVHRAHASSVAPWRIAGFVARDTGIAAATGGSADVKIARIATATTGEPTYHDHDVHVGVALRGTATLGVGGKTYPLGEGDAFTVPRGTLHILDDCSPEFQVLELTVDVRALAANRSPLE